MWPEPACRTAHLAVWQGCGDQAAELLALAGRGTADYILAHRIPSPAKTLIRALPASLGARLLSVAITRHAWTFAGSGRFHIACRLPLTFEIEANPLAFPGRSCVWHVAVFTRLFQALVWPSASVETVEAPPASRFLIRPSPGPLIAHCRALFADASDDARQGGRAAVEPPPRDKTALARLPTVMFT